MSETFSFGEWMAPGLELAGAAFEELFAIGKHVSTFSKGPSAKQALLAEAHFLYGDQLRFAGRVAEAEMHYLQSLELFRQLGNVDLIAYPLGNLGRMALEQGRTKEAYDRLAESVVISRGRQPGRHCRLASPVWQCSPRVGRSDTGRDVFRRGARAVSGNG